MNKVYERINWENEPSIATPLGASNLNKTDYAINEIDNRVIALDTGKANQVDELLDIKEVSYNPTTGVWVFTHQNGTTDTFDQNIEKIPVTFAMDANGVITMTTADGTTYTCDVGTLIKTYTFVNSGNIQFTVTTDAQGNKSVTANIIDGSVTRAKLDPDYLAQIDLDVASASASALAASGSATAASGSATTASNKALDSEAYAIGTRGGVPVTSEDPAYENNAKYWAEQAEQTDIGQIEKVKVSWDDASESVQKNLIPYPYNEWTETDRGITYKDNGDGTVTVSGTATSDSAHNLSLRNTSGTLYLPNGKYILSGCASGGSANSYHLQALITKNNGARALGSDYGNGEIIEVSGDDYGDDGAYVMVRILVINGTAIQGNLTFKPMLRKATIKDDTYAPYILNNNQLVGWSQAEKSVKKNLNSYPYKDTTSTTNGITFTDNGDGTVTANGTATADAYFTCHSRLLAEYNGLIVPNGRYILNGCPANGSTSTYMIQAGITRNNTFSLLGRDTGDGAIVTVNGDDYFSDKVNIQIQCVVKSGTTVNNIVFKPMLRYDNVKDDIFVPYIPDNTELVSWKANGVLGAKNFNSYPYRETSKTVNGVTFTVNTDGSVTVQTDAGGATAPTGFNCHSRSVGEPNDLVVQNGKYVLTGCPSGGANNKYSLSLRATKNGSSYLYGTDFGNGAEMILNGDDYSANEVNVQIDINIASNTIITTPITFYPMLRLAEDTDDTYQPYAMTNYELTQKIAELQAQINALV